MFSYHAYSRSYGNKDVKNGPFFAFSANDSKKLVTVWTKYLTALERSYRILSENGTVTSEKLLSLQKITEILYFQRLTSY